MKNVSVMQMFQIQKEDVEFILNISSISERNTKEIRSNSAREMKENSLTSRREWVNSNERRMIRDVSTSSDLKYVEMDTYFLGMKIISFYTNAG